MTPTCLPEHLFPSNYSPLPNLLDETACYAPCECVSATATNEFEFSSAMSVYFVQSFISSRRSFRFYFFKVTYLAQTTYKNRLTQSESSSTSRKKTKHLLALEQYHIHKNAMHYQLADPILIAFASISLFYRGNVIAYDLLTTFRRFCILICY